MKFFFIIKIFFLFIYLTETATIDKKQNSFIKSFSKNSKLIERQIVASNNVCFCTGGFEINSNGQTICSSDCDRKTRLSSEVECTFPFQYNNTWYDTCTDIDRKGYYWCSIDRIYIGRYADCSQECPLLARSMVASVSGIHTSCRKKTIGWTGIYPSDSEIQLILDVHNKIRSNITDSVADLRQLSWDFGLARLALKLTETGTFAHDCTDCRRLINNQTIYNGQNLFYSWAIPYDSDYWNKVLSGWYSEIKKFRYGIGSITGNWGDVGHYTQLINNATSRVGCALAISGTQIYAACNYADGQTDTKFPYTRGVPCTRCSNCSNKLCRCNKICQNYGTLDQRTCTCNCLPYATGDECEIKLCDKPDSIYGCWTTNKSFCVFSNIMRLCPRLCGICRFNS